MPVTAAIDATTLLTTVIVTIIIAMLDTVFDVATIVTLRGATTTVAPVIKLFHLLIQ